MTEPRHIYPKHFFAEPVPRQKTGFILMPFAPEFDPVHAAIAEGVRQAGLEPLRSDDWFNTRAGLEKILRGIGEAEVVVADLTGRNANVFYEVGIAHMVKENVVLLAREIDEVPFDLRHIDVVVYEATDVGLANLPGRLANVFRELPPERASESGGRPLVDTALADARLAEDLGLLSIEDGPYLAVQAWVPDSRAEIQDIHGDFRRTIDQPEQLRPSGYNLDFSGEFEPLKGGGLRKVSSRRASMSVLPEGLTTVIVSPDYLTWGMQERHGAVTINPYPLVEFTAETCRFQVMHVWPKLSAQHGVFRAVLANLQTPRPALLIRGHLGGFPNFEPAAESAEDVSTGVVQADGWESATYDLLRRLYGGFGIPPKDIPYADVEARRFDAEALKGDTS